MFRTLRTGKIFGLIIAAFFAFFVVSGCTNIQSQQGPPKPPAMDVTPFNPKASLSLELSPGSYYTALIVPSTDSQKVGNRLVLRLYAWQESQKTWKEVYSEPISNMGYPQIKASRIIPDRDSLVMYSQEGSGSFVYLRVLAFINNSYKAIISPNQPQGHSKVVLEGDKIIVETSSGNQTVYMWNGVEVVISKRQREVPPTSASEVHFIYNIMHDGHIEVPSEKITVNEGDTLRIVQGHALAELSGVRLFWNSQEFNKILQYQEGSVAQHQVYKAIGPGSAVLTIVANGGYDWKNARKVTVEVLPKK